MYKFFSQYESIHATRQNDTFSQKFAHINMKSMSSLVKRVKLWNSLDSSLSLSECSSLKKNYKVKMLNSYVSDMLLFMVKQFKSAYWLWLEHTFWCFISRPDMMTSSILVHWLRLSILDSIVRCVHSSRISNCDELQPPSMEITCVYQKEIRAA